MARPRTHSDEHLVAAAARVVAARGPHALTLADVAREAGVAPATLVGRFGSRRDLLLAVAASGPGLVSAAFAGARARTRSPLRALEAALADLASGVSDPDEVANHLAFLAIDLTDPAFRAHAAALTASMRAEVDGLLRDAAARGEIRLHTRAPLVDAVVCAYHGALLAWAIDREGVAADRVRGLVRLLVRPHRAPRPRPPARTPRG